MFGRGRKDNAECCEPLSQSWLQSRSRLHQGFTDRTSNMGNTGVEFECCPLPGQKTILVEAPLLVREPKKTFARSGRRVAVENHWTKVNPPKRINTIWITTASPLVMCFNCIHCMATKENLLCDCLWGVLDPLKILLGSQI